MRWPSAIAALLGIVEADAELLSILGGPHVYRNREVREPRIPSVAYTIVTSVLTETMEPVITQWDIFAASMDQLVGVERRLRRLLHWVGWQDVGGVMLSSVYEESRDHPPPAPGRWHRSLDFRHQPVRERGW